MVVDRQTHIKQVAGHAAALAVLLPHWRHSAGVEAMRRQPTNGTGPARTVSLDVALDATKDTSGTFLLRRTRFFLLFLIDDKMLSTKSYYFPH